MLCRTQPGMTGDGRYCPCMTIFARDRAREESVVLPNRPAKLCMLATKPHSRLYALPQERRASKSSVPAPYPYFFLEYLWKMAARPYNVLVTGSKEVRDIPPHAMLSGADEIKIHQLEVL